MKRLVVVSAALALCMSAPLSHAQCSFQRPKKAKKIQVDMVPAFWWCSGPGGVVPNATSEIGFPACAPPTIDQEVNGGAPANAWVWEPTETSVPELYASSSGGPWTIAPTAIRHGSIFPCACL